MKFLLPVVACSCLLAQVRQSSRLLSGSDPESAAYTGIAHLRAGAQCTGSLLGISELPAAPAYVLTNGHCVRLMAANEVLFDRELRGEATFAYFQDAPERHVRTAIKRAAYATMKGVDLAILELDATTGSLVAQGVKPLGIGVAEEGARVRYAGIPVQTVIHPYLRAASCTLGARTNVLENTWHWWGAYRLDCPDALPGASGSPIISERTGRIVAVLNTTTTSSFQRGPAFDCKLNIPCELTSTGARSVDETSYASPVTDLEKCFDGAGQFDLTRTGCPLDDGRQVAIERPRFSARAVKPGEPWQVEVSGLPYYRYKAFAAGQGDCRNPQGYSPVTQTAAVPLIDAPVGQNDGMYLLCAIGGNVPVPGNTWQKPEFASALFLRVDGAAPRLPVNYEFEEFENFYEVAFGESDSEAFADFIKTGPMDATDCADPEGYRRVFSVPTRLMKTQGPFRICIQSRDEAGHAAPLVEFVTDGFQLLPNGVTHAASFERQVVAPGSLATAFGIHVPAQVEATVTDAAGAGHKVAYVATSSGQINFLVPPGAAPGPATLSVGPRSSGFEITRGAPGVFFAGVSPAIANATLRRVRRDGTSSMEPSYECGAGASYCTLKPLDVRTEGEEMIVEVFVTGVNEADAAAWIGTQPVAVEPLQPVPAFPGVYSMFLHLPEGFGLRGYQYIKIVSGGRASRPAWLLFQ